MKRSFANVNIANWKRKLHYNFYKSFNAPFFNVTVPLDITRFKNYCSRNSINFSLGMLHLITKNTNKVENFKYRIINDEVILWNEIDCGCTVLRPNQTFGFGYFDYYETVFDFNENGKKVIEQVKSNNDLLPGRERSDLIYCSILPWLHFTSFEHADHFQVPMNSVPKITIGKYKLINGVLTLPLSIAVHHALADGYHVGLLVEYIEQELSTY